MSFPFRSVHRQIPYHWSPQNSTNVFANCRNSDLQNGIHNAAHRLIVHIQLFRPKFCEFYVLCLRDLVELLIVDGVEAKAFGRKVIRPVFGVYQLHAGLARVRPNYAGVALCPFDIRQGSTSVRWILKSSNVFFAAPPPDHHFDTFGAPGTRRTARRRDRRDGGGGLWPVVAMRRGHMLLARPNVAVHQLSHFLGKLNSLKLFTTIKSSQNSNNNPFVN